MFSVPPKSILVPMDLSEISFRALSQAELLAAALGAKLKILHVLPAVITPLPHNWYVPREAGVRAGIAAKIRARARLEAPVQVLEGDATAGILHSAYMEEFGLIVMGSHGHAPFGRFLLGSVAAGVIRRAPAPVLVVRGQPGPIRSILAPVNFTDYSREAFVYAGRLAKRLDASLTMLHVDTGESAAPARRMRSWLKLLPRGARHLCTIQIQGRSGSVADTISDVAWERDAVVLSAHRRGAVRDFLLGTTAEQVLCRYPSLVFTVPPAELATERERERWLGLVHAAGR
ncbi:MAG: universal stress protein [Elusimicrobia bacterium]|nr:universal stress protein [Elusimicrobiota bacterium]